MVGYAASIARYDAARQVLAGGVSSNFRYHDLPVPLTFARGQGPWLWDVDGNRYLDFVIGNGAAFLGHSPEAVIAAVAPRWNAGRPSPACTTRRWRWPAGWWRSSPAPSGCAWR